MKQPSHSEVNFHVSNETDATLPGARGGIPMRDVRVESNHRRTLGQSFQRKSYILLSEDPYLNLGGLGKVGLDQRGGLNSSIFPSIPRQAVT